MHAPIPNVEADFEAKRESRSVVRPIVFRLVVAWLAVVLAVGLWQGYADWLFSSDGAHVS